MRRRTVLKTGNERFRVQGLAGETRDKKGLASASSNCAQHNFLSWQILKCHFEATHSSGDKLVLFGWALPWWLIGIALHIPVNSLAWLHSAWAPSSMMDYRLKKQMIFEVNTTSSSLKTCSVDHSFKAKNATLGGRLRLNLSWFIVLLLAMKNHDREIFFLSPYFLPLSVENAILFPTSNLLLNENLGTLSSLCVQCSLANEVTLVREHPHHDGSI